MTDIWDQVDEELAAEGEQQPEPTQQPSAEPDVWGQIERSDAQKRHEEDARLGHIIEFMRESPEDKAAAAQIARELPDAPKLDVILDNLPAWRKAAERSKYDIGAMRRDRPDLIELMLKDPYTASVIEAEEKISDFGLMMGGIVKYRQENPMDAAIQPGWPLLNALPGGDVAAWLLPKPHEVAGILTDALVGEDDDVRPPTVDEIAQGQTGPQTGAKLEMRERRQGVKYKRAEGLSRLEQAKATVGHTWSDLDVNVAYYDVGLRETQLATVEARFEDGQASQEDLDAARRRAWEANTRAIEMEEENGLRPYFGDIGAIQQTGLDAVEGMTSQAVTFLEMGKGAAIGAATGAALFGAAGATQGQTGAGVKHGAKLGMWAGGKVGGFSGAFKLEYGSTLREMKVARTDAGELIDPEIQRGTAVLAGLAKAGVEMSSEFGILFKKGAPAFAKQATRSPWLRGLLKALAGSIAEGGEETVQAGIDTLAKWMGRGAQSQEGVFSQSIDLVAEAETAAEGFRMGVIGAVGFHAAGASITVTRDNAERSRAVNGGNQIAAMVDMLDSQAVKAAPEAVANTLKELATRHDRPMDGVHIDPLRFVEVAQAANADPVELATELMGEQGPAILRQALEDRTDEAGGRAMLHLTAEEFLSQWGTRKELAEQLAGDMTPVRNGWTLNEVVEYEKADQKRIAELTKEFKEAGTFMPETEADVALVEAVENGLKSTGKYTEQAVDDVVALVRAEAEVRRERHGLSQEQANALAAVEIRNATKGEVQVETTPKGPEPMASRSLTETLKQMDPESRAELLYIDRNTGLLNDRGFAALAADPSKPLVAQFSFEGVKWKNAETHSAGNLLYRAAGQALAQAAPDAAKWKGDFVAAVESNEDADRIALEMQANLLEILRESNPEIADQIQGLQVTTGLSERTEDLSGSIDAAGQANIAEKTMREGLPEGDPLRRVERGNKPLGIPVEKPQELMLPTEEPMARGLPDNMLEDADQMTDEDLFNTVYIEQDTGHLTRDGFFALEFDHVVSLDLNGLKAINEAHGFAAGNKVLAKFADRARLAGASKVSFAHLSGDEYAAGFNDPETIQTYVDILSTLCDTAVVEIKDQEALNGIEFGYHIAGGEGSTAANYDAADAGVEAHKNARKKAAANNLEDPERIARRRRAEDRRSNPVGQGRADALQGGDRPQTFAGRRGADNKNVRHGLVAGRGGNKTTAQERILQSVRKEISRIAEVADQTDHTDRGPLARALTKAVKSGETGLANAAEHATQLHVYQKENGIVGKNKVGGLHKKVAQSINDGIKDVLDASYPNGDQISEKADAAFLKHGKAEIHEKDAEAFDTINEALEERGEKAVKVSGIVEGLTRLVKTSKNPRSWQSFKEQIEICNGCPDVNLRLPDEVTERLAAEREADEMLAREEAAEQGVEISEEAELDDDGNLVDDDGEILFQPAWHGTPHRGIDETGFKLEFIGTGEGHQAFGWGIYSAESHGTADWYRETLSRSRATIEIFIGAEKLATNAVGPAALDGSDRDVVLAEILAIAKTIAEEEGLVGDITRRAVSAVLDRYVFQRKTAQDAVDQAQMMLKGELDPADGWGELSTPEYWDNAKRRAQGTVDRKQTLLDQLEALRGGLTVKALEPEVGQLYKMEVPENDEMLDYDAPIDQQPEEVLEKLVDAGVIELRRVVRTLATKETITRDHVFLGERDLGTAETVKGQDLYDAIGDSDPDNNNMKAAAKASSMRLLEAGIPGLRYLDGVSRDSGKGTHNFVVWDESRMPITETLYQKDPDPKNLVVVHNLTEANLEHVLRDFDGDIPAPSISVSRKEHPLENFGEISLIGGPDLVDPKTKTPVFDADVYSPRWPTTRHKVNDKARQALKKDLADELEVVDGYMSDGGEFGGGIDAALKKDTIRRPLALRFLREKGLAPEPKTRQARLQSPFVEIPDALALINQYREANPGEGPTPQLIEALTAIVKANYGDHIGDQKTADEMLEPGSGFIDDDGQLTFHSADQMVVEAHKVGMEVADHYGNRDAVDDVLEHNSKLKAEFEEWARKKLEPVIGDKYIQKWTDHPIEGPKERRVAYNLKNVLRELTKKIRAGEDFHYGLGTARSKGAKRYRSIKAIQKDRDRIIPSMDFDEARREMDSRLVQEAGFAARFHPGDAHRAFVEAVADSYKIGARRALVENGFDFDNETDLDVRARALAEFAQDLVEMPTEYFEAKPQRAVGLSEFKAAVVPEDVKPETIEALEAAGLEVVKYGGIGRLDGPPGRQETTAQVAEKLEVLFQNDKATPRGWVKITREAIRNTFEILLTDNANISTPLHELAHTYLEMLAELSTAPNVTDDVKAGWSRVLKYLGAKDLASVNERQKEKWARAFEAYLLEGKAPSRNLVEVFTRLRVLLLETYDTAEKLQVELDDDIRRVFDSLLATDRELEVTREQMGISAPLFNREDFDGTDAEWKVYQKHREDSNVKAALRVQREVAIAQKKVLTKEWRKQVRENRAVAKEEYDAQPGFRAWRLIRRGEVTFPDGRLVDVLAADEAGHDTKVNRKSIIDAVGRGHPIMNKLRGRVLKEGGRDMAELAERFGFEDAKRMIEAIVALPDKAKWVRERAEELTRKAHPELALEKERINEAAAEALHNEDSVQALLREWRQDMQRAGIPAVPPLKELEAVVERLVEDMPHRSIRLKASLDTERKEAERRVAAIAKNDWEGAAQHKRNQILAHLTHKRLSEAKKDREQFEALAKKARNVGTRKRMGSEGQAMEFFTDIDWMLESLGLGKKVSDKEVLDARVERIPLQSIGESALQKVGLDMVTPRYGDIIGLIMQPPKDGYKRLTIAEVRQFHLALKQLWTAAREVGSIVVDGKRRKLNKVAWDIATEAAANNKKKGRKLAFHDTADSKGTQPDNGTLLQRLDQMLVRVQELFRQLGPTAYNALWTNGYLPARDKANELSEKVSVELDRMWEQMPKKMRKSLYDNLTDLEGVEPPIGSLRAGQRNRMWMMMVALNMGNESNKERLLGGMEWDGDSVIAWLGRNMTEEEKTFVQGVWDLLDKTLWPHVKDTYIEVNGIPPAKVDATPLQIGGTLLRGGYFPAKFDPKQSKVADHHPEGDDGRIAVQKGFVAERVSSYEDVIDLHSWGMVPGHIASVIHYVAHERYIRQAARIVGHEAVKGAISEHLGAAHDTTIKEALKRVAKPAMTPKDLGLFYRLLMAGKSRFAMATLAGSLPVFIADQFNGLMGWAMGNISGRGLMHGYRMTNPVTYKKTRERVLALSPEMRNRDKNWSRSLRQQLGEMGGQTGKRGELGKLLDQARDAAWFLMKFGDDTSATLIWTSAFDDAQSRMGMTEDEAIAHADDAVHSSLPSHDTADLPAIMGNKGTAASFVMFFGYFNTVYNANRRLFKERSAPEAFARTILMFMVANVIGEAFGGRGPEEDEEIPEWIARKTLAAPFTYIPGLAGAAEWGIGGLTSYLWHDEARMRHVSMKAAPAMSTVQRFYRAGQRILDDETESTDRFFAYLDAIGLITHLPIGASQVQRTGKYLTGDEFPKDVRQGDIPGVLSGVAYGSRDRQPTNPVSAFSQRNR